MTSWSPTKSWWKITRLRQYLTTRSNTGNQYSSSLFTQLERQCIESYRFDESEKYGRSAPAVVSHDATSSVRLQSIQTRKLYFCSSVVHNLVISGNSQPRMLSFFVYYSIHFNVLHYGYPRIYSNKFLSVFSYPWLFYKQWHTNSTLKIITCESSIV